MVKRVVVGAHYGLRDWLIQRITAVIMLFYLLLLGAFFISASEGGYANWQKLFSCYWVKIFTSVTAIALLLHGWVGMRDVWMDYLQSVWIRLTMHVFTLVWLVGCVIYSYTVIWGN